MRDVNELIVREDVNELIVREIKESELPALLSLYEELHGEAMPEPREVKALWREIMSDKNHHIVVGALGGEIVSSCIIVVVPNLTHGQRPYAFIENVVTSAAHRNKGYATAVLNGAREIAEKARCYKIMLMTSSKEESTLRFYERAGYNRSDKTAFIQWLRES